MRNSMPNHLSGVVLNNLSNLLHLLVVMTDSDMQSKLGIVQ